MLSIQDTNIRYTVNRIEFCYKINPVLIREYKNPCLTEIMWNIIVILSVTKNLYGILHGVYTELVECVQDDTTEGFYIHDSINLLTYYSFCDINTTACL